MRCLFLMLIPFFVTSSLLAQVSGDFRSAGSGDWNNTGTWQRYDGTAWVSAVSTPTSADGAISIETGHTVTVPSGVSVSVDQLTVIQQLTIAFGGQLTLVNGTGTDLTATTAASLLQVSGILVVSNGATIDNQSVASSMTFLSGSEYRHGYTTTFGDLPTATWDANSTIRITGYTNSTTITANSTWNQSVGHVIFNAPGQQGLVDFAGNLTTIQGNFSIVSTGNNALQLSSAQNPTITIQGNLDISGTARLTVAITGTATILNVNGDWNYTSTNVTGSYLTVSGNTTVNLTGDFIMNASGGRMHMASAGTTGVGTINLNGDFLLQNGRIDELGSNPTRGILRFIANGIQNFVNNGSFVGYFSYYVGPTTTLDLSIYPLVGVTPSSFTLDGTLVVGSPDLLGAIQTGTTRGNIRTPAATRVFSSGSTIIYRGTDPLFVGKGQPTAADRTIVIDNALGVGLTADITLNGLIRLESGFLDLNDFTLTSNATIEYNTGVLRGTDLSRLVVGGSTGGNWGEIRLDATYDTLSVLNINRSGSNAQADLVTPVVITSGLYLTHGNLNNTGGISFINNALVTRYETSALLGLRPTIPTGTYSVSYRSTNGTYATGLELPDPTDQTSLGSLIVNTGQAANTINLNQNINVNGDVTFTRGIFNMNTFTLTMRGATWADNAGSVTAPAASLVIFDGVTNVGGTANPTFTNIRLNASKSLTFTRSFSIAGNIDFEPGSNFSMGAFTATFSGNLLQQISANGATFSNITVSKSGGADVQLTSSLNLTGILQFISPSASVDFMSGGFLTLISTSDIAAGGTASIYRLQSGNTVSGNVTVQRFVSGEGKIYRYLSSPVSGAFVSQWKDDFAITGPFLDPSPKQIVCAVYTNPASTSLYYYDESVAGDVDTGYIAYPRPEAATTNSPIVVGRGYAAYIRQCTIPTVVDVTGPINQGQITFPITYTNSASSGDGWNLVGNPYPATIDWDATTWTKTNIASIISIMDNGAGMVRYYDPGVTEDIPNGEIAAGQAFWVRTTAASPLLRIQEAAKVTSDVEFYRQAFPDIPSFVLKFSDGEHEDKAYVKILDNATVRLDDYDGPKLPNPTFNFSTVSEDDVPMAINALDQLTCNGTIRIGMKDVEMKSYSVGLEIRGEYFDDYRFILIDHFLQKEINLNEQAHYSFEITAQAGSKAQDRFSLRTEQIVAPITLAAATPLTVCDQASSAVVVLESSSRGVAYSLLDETGKQVSAEVTGTGNSISISYPLDSLTLGPNVLTIQAKSMCSDLLTSTVSVEKSRPEIVSVNSAPLDNGTVRFTVQTNPDSGIVYWYEQPDGGEPTYIGHEFVTPVLTTSKVYYVSVTTVQGECSSARVMASAVITEVAPEELAGLKVYPNPVKKDLFVDVLNEDIVKIEFANTMGQVVSSLDMPEAQLYSVDFGAFSKGIYLMIVTKRTGKKSIRLLKE